MTVQLHTRRPAAPARIAVVPAAERAWQLAADAAGPAPLLAIEGPGDSGKSLLLTELAAAHRSVGRTVVASGVIPDPVVGGTDVAVLVDDAHDLPAGALGPIIRLLDRPGVSVTVAYRPWPRSSQLTDLIERMGRQRQLVALGHADRRTVFAWARAGLGDTATTSLVDAIHAETGGLPGLVHGFLDVAVAAVAGRRPSAPPSLTDARGRVRLPAPLVDAVRSQLAALDESTRALLHSVAAGAPVETELLGDLLGLPSGLAGDAIAHGRACGWLLPDGTLVPLVRRVLLSVSPADRTRQVRRRLLGLLLDRGEEPLELARSLAAEGVRDVRAAGVLERCGTQALTGEPALAAELFAAAVSSGAPAARLAARQAQAASLAGDVDEALRLADAVLTDPEAPDRPRAARVAAAALARRGLPSRSAELYRLAGPASAGSAAVALLATGDRAGAEALLRGDDQPSPEALTMLAGSEELMARGILRSLGGTDGDVAAALSTLTRASLLLEPVGRGAVLLDTPAALAALVALHCGELDVAESVLRRALSAELGGAPPRRRHLLLLAWVDMLRGRFGSARGHMDLAQDWDGCGMEPRDDLFLQALEVGLARRSSDLPALVRAWARVRQAMLRHPIELFTLLPLGELIVAAARLRDAERLAPHVAEAEALLDRLGRPHLWATALHWSGVQAAILTDDLDALRPHAAALRDVARTLPYAAVLARAGRCLLRVLRNEIDASAVVSAAEQLGTVGLAWDGSRLAGQAAARAVDPRDRTVLLSCARTLADGIGDDRKPRHASTQVLAVPAEEADAGMPAGLGGQLSEREREVARLVVAGQTYREIGERLFISAKTVEHHVARMRQRLGAETRSDLLSRLRAELGSRE